MAKRTKSQQIGAQGERLVEYIIESSKNWIARTQDQDYKLDLEAELSDKEVRGEIIKIQVKSKENIERRSEKIVSQLPKSLVDYSNICRIPIIFVVVDISTEDAWYLWVQKWLLYQRRNGTALNTLPESITIEISETNTLKKGLQSELIEVAKFSTNEQLIISLIDTIKTASYSRSVDILAPLVQIISQLDTLALAEDFPIELVVDEVVSLGNRIWATDEGNRTSQLLFNVCRALGKYFNSKHIQQLVQRNDTFSRTGINALGILYNKFPQHVKTLRLVNLFENLGLALPAYYCSLRERYLGVETTSLLNSNTNFSINGLTIPAEYIDDLFTKWINRGDSVLLDYIVKSE